MPVKEVGPAEAINPPVIEAPTTLVAVVADWTDPVTVKPMADEMSAPVAMSRPVPEAAPTVALPVSVTCPAGAASLPAICSPVPVKAVLLLKVPFRVTLPPELETVAPLATSSPRLLTLAVEPVVPVMEILPVLVTTAPVASLVPAVSATEVPTPELPVMVSRPPLAAMSLFMTNVPLGEPELAKWSISWPVNGRVPAPVLVIFERVPLTSSMNSPLE